MLLKTIYCKIAENVKKIPKVGHFYVMTKKVTNYLYSSPCGFTFGKRNIHRRFRYISTSVKIILRYLYSWLEGDKLADNSREMLDRFGEIKPVTLWNRR